MKSSQILFLATCALVVFIARSALAQKNPPAVPLSFTMNYNLSLDFLRPNETILTGTLAMSYLTGDFLWSIKDVADSDMPMSFETTLLGTYNFAKGYVDVYFYVSDSRCFLYDLLDRPQQIPTYPDGMEHKGSMTISGCKCNVWTLNSYGVVLEIALRVNDTAIMYVRLYEATYPDFGFQMTANWVVNSAALALFKAPAGPCITNPFLPPAEEEEKKRTVSDFVISSLFQESGFLSKAGKGLKSLLAVPPKLHPYFIADFIAGYGELSEKDGFKTKYPMLVGQTWANSKTNAYAVSVTQGPLMPFNLNTTFIFSPDQPGSIIGFLYLEEGRCWQSAYSVYSPEWPFVIPKDASYLGTTMVYGQKASLWEWSVSYREYNGNVTMAVQVSDSAPLFFSTAGYAGYGGYTRLMNYKPVAPNPSKTAPPKGECPYVYFGWQQ
jgi:hypothetical protein